MYIRKTYLSVALHELTDGEGEYLVVRSTAVIYNLECTNI
jgi:hypothetical protein